MSQDIVIKENQIVASDDVILNGDLYRPVCDNKVPVIIMRTPYGKHNINAVYDPLSIVRQGFALLVQNVRGRFESNGKFVPFENEREDVVQTIEWLCNQEWCNGNIYATGVSYEGFTAILAGMNEHTKGIAPIMASSNIHRDWFYENHCIKQGFLQSWSHGFAFTDNGAMLHDFEIDRVQRLASDLKSLYQKPMSQFPVSGYLPYYKSWMNEQDTEYWEMIKEKTSGKVTALGYFVSGWYDIFCEGTLKEYFTIAESSDKPQKLVVGPWSHIDLFGGVVGDIDFGYYSLEKYSVDDILKWFQKIEQKEPMEAEILLYMMGKNKWLRLKTFPEAEYVPYYFQIQKDERNEMRRTLTADKYGDAVQDIFCFDSSNLVPTCGGRCIDAIPEALGGPKYQDLIEQREDVLVYSSEILLEEVSVLGEVKVQIGCLSTLERMDFTVKICDVNEQGKSVNILDSCLRIENDADIVKEYNLNLGTVAHTFMAGHRIRCQIASSNFPRLNVQDWLLGKTAENTVFLGGKTHLLLPVVNGID